MKKALLAAVAVLGVSAWTAPAAFAQNHEWRGQHERGDRGDRGARRNDGDNGRRGGDDQRHGERQHNNAPQAQPPRRDFGQAENAARLRQQMDARRENWSNRAPERRIENNDRGRAGRDWNGRSGADLRGGPDDHGRRDNDRVNRGPNNRGDGARDWADRGGGDNRNWTRDRNTPNRDGQNRDWQNRDRDSRNRGDRDRDRDWNRGRGDQYAWNNDRGRNRGWDGHRGNNWNDHGRNDDRYRRYWNTHRDFAHPRWSDWRQVRRGYYFDYGYANIAGGYWGHSYRWWSYPRWSRPYRPYIVGYALPYDLYWDEVPYDLYWRLPPAPYGCRYVMVDRDILLIAISSGIILDALLYY